MTAGAKLCHGLRAPPTVERRRMRPRIPSRALPALAALLLAVSALPGPALAQASRVAEIATYQGADRAQRRVEGARREKGLTLYASIPTADTSIPAAPSD